MFRKCKKCGSEFEAVGKDTMRICKKCNCERVKKKPTAGKMLNRARNRCRLDGTEINIDKSDIVIPEFCPILGIKLREISGKVGGDHNSPSLDRLDPRLGYVKGNVHVISHIANRMKFNATPEELIKFAEWVLKTYKPSVTNDHA